eukprot:761104-Hanusia_phi.AAC.2
MFDKTRGSQAFSAGPSAGSVTRPGGRRAIIGARPGESPGLETGRAHRVTGLELSSDLTRNYRGPAPDDLLIKNSVTRKLGAAPMMRQGRQREKPELELRLLKTRAADRTAGPQTSESVGLGHSPARPVSTPGRPAGCGPPARPAASVTA